MINDTYYKLQSEAGGGFNCFFAFILESIGLRSLHEENGEHYVTTLPNRQIDFIATLPALGEAGAIELRHVCTLSAAF